MTPTPKQLHAAGYEVERGVQRDQAGDTWYRNANGRVVLRADGTSVYCFDGHALAWSAEFGDSAPVRLVMAAAKAAR